MSFHCPTHKAIEEQFLKNERRKLVRTKDATKEVWLIQKTCPNCGQDVYHMEDDQET